MYVCMSYNFVTKDQVGGCRGVCGSQRPTLPSLLQGDEADAAGGWASLADDRDNIVGTIVPFYEINAIGCMVASYR